jgi:UDP-N-acetylglucosamine 3-dehydrogenase
LKRVGIGVVGTGFWGENQVRVFRQSKNCNLLGICDSNSVRAREVGAKYNVPAHTSLQDLLQTPDIEAVTVCTPTHTHLQVATQALEAGKSLLVEKPMTGETRSAQKLISLAQKNGCKLLVGFIERFNPGVRLVKGMLQRKAVGDVIILTGRRVARWPERIGDVGVVKDTAIHDVDIMRYLLGTEVATVTAQTGSLRHTFEDYAEIMLRFRDSTSGFIDANWLTPRKVRTLIITGSEATINLDYITQEITVEDSEKLTKPHAKWDEPLRLELESFIKVVQEDLEPNPSGKDALEAIRICEAALESGKKRELVELPQ